ncbi:MAG: glycosyltransferase family 2 protein [Alphaproteobacteria bacterium]|nr:glycosyltransferase family 2 protein [Alphaproteobacteria bacterium]
MAIGAFCTGDRSEARRLLTLAVGSTPLRRYHAWRRQRLRDMDCASLDAPRSDWSRGPRIHFVVFASIGNVAWLRRLLAQLEAQVYPNWSLWVVSPDAVALGEALSADAAPGRLHLRSSDDGVATVCDTASADDLFCLLEVGCVLPFYAPAVVAEHAAARPRTLFFYGDQDALDGAGRYADPRLYPAWSPAFATATDYATSALFVRGRCLAQLGAVSLGDLARERRLCDALASAAAEDIMHIRRVLVTRSSQPRRTEPTASLSPAPPEVTGEMAGRPCATMVIPSKDRPRLLATCLRGLREATTPADFEVVIVDNGSTDSETLALYDSLAGDHRVRVLHRPGPFNFSFLCNEGAHAARAPVVVFLNNDIEIVDRQWLQPLLSWAAQPDVGAVGAKLLYPSGRLQHGGVVVGLAGSTGHIDRGARRGEPGYLARLTVPHEVSAVTGACLVVQKKKFDAIGGFDAEHLPVELNDIDLCLRLDARGWRTIFTPQSVLIHHESASRGRSQALSPKYEPERTFFRSRWGARLRDDPYFHPALSLVSIRTALG